MRDRSGMSACVTRRSRSSRSLAVVSGESVERTQAAIAAFHAPSMSPAPRARHGQPVVGHGAARVALQLLVHPRARCARTRALDDRPDGSAPRDRAPSPTSRAAAVDRAVASSIARLSAVSNSSAAAPKISLRYKRLSEADEQIDLIARHERRRHARRRAPRARPSDPRRRHAARYRSRCERATTSAAASAHAVVLRATDAASIAPSKSPAL